jgi:hypothetical protein
MVTRHSQTNQTSFCSVSGRGIYLHNPDITPRSIERGVSGVKCLEKYVRPEDVPRDGVALRLGHGGSTLAMAAGHLMSVAFERVREGCRQRVCGRFRAGSLYRADRSVNVPIGFSCRRCQRPI